MTTPTPIDISKIMTYEEVNRFFEIIDHRKYRTLFKLIYYCGGLRLGEAVKLKVSDVDISSRKIKIMHSKSGIIQFVPIPDLFYQEFMDYYKRIIDRKEIWLFPSDKEYYKPICKNTCWLKFKDYLRRADLPTYYHPHSLRHAIATHIYNDMLREYGIADIKILQEMLGHKNPGSTMHYLHVEPDLIKQKIEHFLDKART